MSKVKISDDLSDAIKVAAFFSTVLVVSIHYNTLHFIGADTQLSWNEVVQQLLTNGVARVAVPFFALTAGIFFFRSLVDRRNYLYEVRKRFFTILIPYLIACTFILTVEVVYKFIFKGELYQITLKGLSVDIFFAPVAVQFWFLRDLIVLTIFSPFILLAVKYFGLLFLFVLGGFWFSNVEIFLLVAGRPLIAVETMFFFSIGAWIVTVRSNVEVLLLSTPLINVRWLIILYGIIMIFRTIVSSNLLYPDFTLLAEVWLGLHKVSVIIGTFLLVPIAHICKSYFLLFFAQYNFFVFLYHTYPLNRLIVYLSDQFVSDEYKFYVTFPAAVVISLCIAYYCKSWFEKFYSVLVGSR